MKEKNAQFGLMVAAPRSGSGKTTVTLGLLRALAARGMQVGSFKCGPDYIDPAFHRVATGRASFNLDSWTMPGRLLDRNVVRGAAGAEMLIAEGSMGLFDGVATPGAAGDGASADIAARYGLPVVLVIDASGQSQSAGAVALGFRNFSKHVKIAGVVLGNIASDRHRILAERGLERAGIPVFGALARGAAPSIPERHLGLLQAEEIPNVQALIEALANAIEKHVDIDAILAASAPVIMPKMRTDAAALPPGKRIALAMDAAFSFIYPHMLAQWREGGAEILSFSPLADEPPDGSADICWLPGGYPELYAQQLSGNNCFFDGLRAFSKQKPVHGECGGYMVLGEALTDASGKSWNMAGLLPVSTSFARRKLQMGYRTLKLAETCAIGKKGCVMRGHEFHYATIVATGDAEPLGETRDANGVSLGMTGQRVGQVTGSFFHMVALDE